ncbi:MAG: hypothetical protein K2X28_06375 [Alphaproteobacteria bacterium]|nr:hypothetical protein [Alphaproteobacteria bacterium]
MLRHIGRFTSTLREEGDTWNPMIVEILQHLNHKKDPSKLSILEKSLQYYLRSNARSSSYSGASISTQVTDEGDVEPTSGHIEISTYFNYLPSFA